LPNVALKGAAPNTWRIDSYEKWIKEKTRLDDRSCAYLESTGSKENHSGEDRQNPKANRGRNAAKSVQSGIISRLPGLKLRTSRPQSCIIDSSPAMCGAFFQSDIAARSTMPRGTILRCMKVEEIAEAIAKLPPDQLARFRG